MVNEIADQLDNQYASTAVSFLAPSAKNIIVQKVKRGINKLSKTGDNLLDSRLTSPKEQGTHQNIPDKSKGEIVQQKFDKTPESRSPVINDSLIQTQIKKGLGKKEIKKQKRLEKELLKALEQPPDIIKIKGLQNKKIGRPDSGQPPSFEGPTLAPHIKAIELELQDIKTKSLIAWDNRKKGHASHAKQFDNPEKQHLVDIHDQYKQKRTALENKRRELIAREKINRGTAHAKSKQGGVGLVEERNRIKALVDYEDLPEGIMAMDFIKKTPGVDGLRTFRQHFFTINKKILHSLKRNNVNESVANIWNIAIEPKMRIFQSDKFKRFGNRWNTHITENGLTLKEKYNYDFPASRVDPSFHFELDIGIGTDIPDNWTEIRTKLETMFRLKYPSNIDLIIYFKN